MSARNVFIEGAVAAGLAIAIGTWVTQADLWWWAEVALWVIAAGLFAGAMALSWRGLLLLRRAGSQGEALFSLRLPQAPRAGHIDNHETVLFEQALVTKHAIEARALRFGLAMPDREFLDFGDFQAIYQERLSIHGQYLSNPLDLPTNRQGMLAFIHAPGSTGLADTFELSIVDTYSQRSFAVSSLGEHTFYSDDSVKKVNLLSTGDPGLGDSGNDQGLRNSLVFGLFTGPQSALRRPF